MAIGPFFAVTFAITWLLQLPALHIGAAWCPLALLLPGMILLVGTAMYWLLGGPEPRWFCPPSNVPSVITRLVFPIGEELGWRGLAMPRMQQRYGSGVALLLMVSDRAAWERPILRVRPHEGELLAPE